MGNAHVVVPQNISAAVNYDCLACVTQALAVQLVARQNDRSALQPGDAVGLDIVPASFHLFDRQGQLVPARAS